MAVTEDASLLVALSLMGGRWEVVPFSDPEEAAALAPGFSFAVVDMRTTYRGLEAAETIIASGTPILCIVIGDSEASDSEGIRVLVPPFTLQELVDAVEEGVRAWRPPEPAAPEPEPAAPEPEPAPEPELAAPEPEPEPAPAAPEPEPEPAAPEPEPAPAPAPREPEREPEPAAQEPELEPEPEPVAVRAEEPAPVPAAPEPGEPSPVPLTRMEAPPPRRDDRRVLGGERDRGPAHEAALAALSSWLRRFFRRSPAPPAGPLTTTPAPGATTAGIHPAVPAAVGGRDPPGGREDILQRLELTEAAIHQLEQLLQELPALADLGAIARAFVAEVVERFSPQVVNLCLPAEGGTFESLAHHGLSPNEARLPFPPSHPLYAEVVNELRAVLVSPVDMIQGLVAGIGGAHTEALMIAPLAADGICHGVIVAGAPALTRDDLDSLVGLAAEAAPGLAVARLLERLGPAPGDRAAP